MHSCKKKKSFLLPCFFILYRLYPDMFGSLFLGLMGLNVQLCLLLVSSYINFHFIGVKATTERCTILAALVAVYL